MYLAITEKKTGNDGLRQFWNNICEDSGISRADLFSVNHQREVSMPRLCNSYTMCMCNKTLGWVDLFKWLRFFWVNGLQNGVSIPTPPGNLVKMQILQLHPRPTEPLTLGMGSSNLLLTGSQAILMSPNFGNHCYRSYLDWYTIEDATVLFRHLGRKTCLSLSRNNFTRNVGQQCRQWHLAHFF